MHKNGNFYFVLLINQDDKNELEKCCHFSGLIVSEALKVGGTCTGEHWNRSWKNGLFISRE